MLDLSADELLTTTRAVRRRLDLERPVQRSVIEKCLEIGFQAPNGQNMQAWAWVAVDDPATRAQMADIYRAGVMAFHAEIEEAAKEGREGPLERMGVRITDPNSRQKDRASADHLYEHLHEVPVLVIPVLRTRVDNLRLYEAATTWGSIMPAAWNFMLALRSRGLGTTWTTAHLGHHQDMANLLGIPANTTQIGMFPVAYTIGTNFKPANRRPVTEVVSWNRWGG